MTRPSHYTVSIGGVDVTVAATVVQIKNQLSDRPTASLTLRLSRLSSSAIDLGSQVLLSHPDGPLRMFTGEIVSAAVDREFAHLEAMTGLELTDTSVSRGTLFGLQPIEQMRTLLWQAGMRESEFDLGDFPEPPHEYFEATFPVTGITVVGRQPVGRAVFLDASIIRDHPWFRSRAVDDSISRAFLQADCFVLVGGTARWTTDAEESAYPRAIEAVARITVDRRLTSLLGPQATVRPYRRSDARVVPAVLPFAMVRGAITGRGWVRDMNVSSRLAPIDLTTLPIGADSFQALPEDLRQCMLSLYRSVSSDLPLSRNLALWDAIEFYTAHVGEQKLFSRGEQKQLLRQVVNAGEWTTDQRTRLLAAKQMLNSIPLLHRLRRRLDADDVPYSEHEFEAITRVRAGRNHSVHGREAADLHEVDFRTAVQVMARAFAYSAVRYVDGSG